MLIGQEAILTGQHTILVGQDPILVGAANLYMPIASMCACVRTQDHFVNFAIICFLGEGKPCARRAHVIVVK